MATNRTYLVQMSTTDTEPLDIVLSLPGSANAPVGGSGVSAPKTAPPSGWKGQTDGLYYEWRGRPVRIENDPAARLGWSVSVGALTNIGAVPGVLPSEGVIGTLPPAFINLPDPSYGPVVRLINDATVAGGRFAVHLTIFGQQDEDAAPRGP